MLFRKIYIIVLLTFIYTFSTNGIFAQEVQESKLPVVVALELERKGKFLIEPGNNDYEILRRIGREINKEISADKNKINAAILFDASKIGTKNALQTITEENLSNNQKEETLELLTRHNTHFLEIEKTLPADKEAILAKGVLESDRVKKIIDEILKKNTEKIGEEEKKKITQSIYPVLDNCDYVLSFLSMSNKGIFIKGKMVSEINKIKDIDTGKITISDYVNEKALIYFIQNHGKTDIDKTYEDLKLIPQTSIIENALKAADLDFKKDILSNSSEESIIYLNLEPSGDGSLPDFRMVSPVPDIKALRAILPKLKQFCIQMGLYAEVKEDDIPYPAVKISFLMLKNYAVYLGLVDDFLVITTGYNNIKDEMAHIVSIKKKKATELKNPLGKYIRYGKIRTKDFNMQIQRLLASPLLQNQGIPPIPNLNFLDDVKDVTFSLEVNESDAQINLEIPIAKK